MAKTPKPPKREAASVVSEEQPAVDFDDLPRIVGGIGVARGSSQAMAYSVPASETEQGKKRIAEYHAALGRFVDMYSRAEIAVQSVLRFYAKLPANYAHILFNGTRADKGIDLVKTLAKEGGAKQEALDELTYVLAQLRAINTTRNNLLHWGAQDVAEGEAYVLTALEGVAEDAKGARRFPMSPDILRHMTDDLYKIIIQLRVGHMGLPEPKGAFGRVWVDKVRADAWRYTPAQPRPQGSQDRGR